MKNSLFQFDFKTIKKPLSYFKYILKFAQISRRKIKKKPDQNIVGFSLV